MALKTQTRMDRSPPGGVVVAAAFEGDEIEELGERIVALTTDRLRSLHKYLQPLLGDAADFSTSGPSTAGATGASGSSH